MNDIVREIKYLINLDKLDALQMLYQDLQEQHSNKEYKYNFEYLWQTAYIHACLKKRIKIKDWLFHLYESMDDIQKIALKPNLIYGKYV
jgi:hypothetical protein